MATVFYQLLESLAKFIFYYKCVSYWNLLLKSESTEAILCNFIHLVLGWLVREKNVYDHQCSAVFSPQFYMTKKKQKKNNVCFRITLIRERTICFITILTYFPSPYTTLTPFLTIDIWISWERNSPNISKTFCVLLK